MPIARAIQIENSSIYDAALDINILSYIGQQIRMPRIAGVTTAVPRHKLEQIAVKHFAQNIFGANAERLLPVFDNALIDSRYFVSDMEWFAREHSFTEANDLFIQASLDLTQQAVVALADRCSISTEDFDVIFFVSTTGLSTPSIDARLFNRISLNPHIKRIPIWGLGCAGGAGGIARAFDYLKAYPNHRGLVVSVELCSLAFQINDRRKSNIIATALFGDGAAACLVVGDDVPISENGMSHPSIVGSLSTIYPETLDVMGWRITSSGFEIVLSKDIPTIVTSLVKENVDELLTTHNVRAGDVHHYIAHPGGAKVMEAYTEALDLKNGDLGHSFAVLREYGNMSSTTVFFILERYLRKTKQQSGEYGLVSALGPGFSSELVLLKWD